MHSWAYLPDGNVDQTSQVTNVHQTWIVTQKIINDVQSMVILPMVPFPTVFFSWISLSCDPGELGAAL